MCYAIPGKIVELKDGFAIVDYYGERRKVLTDLEEVKVGDYVYAQGGYLIAKVPEEEALETLRLWEELFFELKDVDLEISKGEKPKIEDKQFLSIIEKAKRGISLEKKEILKLLETEEEEKLDLLYKIANELRQKYLKNSCCVHGIIEFSNLCKNDCWYCGIRKENKNLERYRMSIEEVVNVADYAVNKLGFKALVLQSGEDYWYTTEKLVEMIRRIKEKCGVLLFMSVGERSLECYEKMYEAGARGVLLRFETSNPELFRKIHPRGKNLKERIKILKYAYELGYLIVTGSLIGLPGQTKEDLVEDILLTKSLNAEMWSFGPLISHPDTPLAKTPLVDLDTVLKVLAVSRLVESEAKILVTTALETLDKENGKRKGLLAGANSLMINVTPRKYRKQYAIYPGRPDQDKEITKNIEETLNLLYSLGRAPTDLGTSR